MKYIWLIVLEHSRSNWRKNETFCLFPQVAKNVANPTVLKQLNHVHRRTFWKNDKAFIYIYIIYIFFSRLWRKTVPGLFSIHIQTKYCLLYWGTSWTCTEMLRTIKPTCRVPNGDVVGSPLLEEESSSDCAQRVFKPSLRVSVEKRRFPHVHVSQNDHLNIRLPHFPCRGHWDSF